MRRLGSGLLAALYLLTAGCSVTLRLHGGDLVNPLDPQRLDPIKNSQELALRIYQLRDHPKVAKVLNIPWELFISNPLPQELHPFLAVPADTVPSERPTEDFYIQRGQHKTLPFERTKGTRWLLVVPRGVRPGERSTMTLLRLGILDTEASFCLDRYDVFQRASRLWPCLRDEE